MFLLLPLASRCVDDFLLKPRAPAPETNTLLNVSPLWEPASSETPYTGTKIRLYQPTVNLIIDRHSLREVQKVMAGFAKGKQRAIEVLPRKLASDVVQVMHLQYTAVTRTIIALAPMTVASEDRLPASLPFYGVPQHPIGYGETF